MCVSEIELKIKYRLINQYCTILPSFMFLGFVVLAQGSQEATGFQKGKKSWDAHVKCVCVQYKEEKQATVISSSLVYWNKH